MVLDSTITAMVESIEARFPKYYVSSTNIATVLDGMNKIHWFQDMGADNWDIFNLENFVKELEQLALLNQGHKN